MDLHGIMVRSLIGPAWARWERSDYLRNQRALRRTQYDAPGVIRRRQWQAVKAMLAHAYATVPFYRRRMGQAGLYPDAVRNWADFARLPVLTKADIRTARDELRSQAYLHRPVHHKSTSGSTGVSLEVVVDERAAQWKRACTLRANEWSGWRFGEPVALLWGNPDYLQRGWRGRFRNYLLDRAAYLDTLHVDEAAMARFHARLRGHRPTLVFGHAHSVYLFADYLRSLPRHDVRPRGIITTAMVLHDWQRRVIEDVLGCPVTNRYGCEEVSLIACECERHEGLHVNTDGVHVEIVRDGQPARPGEPGSVVVTDLANRAMPLLRYQVGDVAVASARRCACGRGQPLLERVEGRDADYVTTPSGQMISGISLTENFALKLPEVAQLQIVQETLTDFRFRIVRGREFGPDSMDRIEKLVHERFGPGVAYRCEFVERIAPEPSGKYRFCVSKVANRFTQPRQEVSK
jgi:phenylacetate-CoA ligase